MRRSIAVAVMLSALLVTPASAAHAQGRIEPAAERFVLSGLIVFDGGTGLAWLQEPALTGNQVVLLRPGDSIGPYRLTQILEDRVELEGPAGKVLVPIYNASGAPGTAVASAAPQAPRPAAPPRAQGAVVATPAVPSAPAAARASEPPGPPRLDAALAALRARAEEARRQAQEQRAAEASEPAPSEVVNPFASNPNVRYFPPGDPSRRQGFQNFLGGR